VVLSVFLFLSDLALAAKACDGVTAVERKNPGACAYAKKKRLLSLAPQREREGGGALGARGKTEEKNSPNKRRGGQEKTLSGQKKPLI
jgi:hypothetical protein